MEGNHAGVHRQDPQLHPRDASPLPTTQAHRSSSRFGNEASEADIFRKFAERFNCNCARMCHGSGRSAAHNHPPGLVDAQRRTGHGRRQHRGLRPETGEECPRARFDAAGRLLNADEAVGEIVNTDQRDTFEGYYNNEEACTKVRGGIYWSGRFAYRDEAGWFLLRRPIERMAPRRQRELRRRAGRAHRRTPPADPLSGGVRGPRRTGRRPRDGRRRGRRPRDFRRRGVRRVPAGRSSDLGTACSGGRARPARFPKLASMKLDKTRLRREAWRAPAVLWRPARGDRLRPMTSADAQALAHLLP